MCVIDYCVFKCILVDEYMIKYLVMDVDGTLTDGKIYMSPSGEAMKAFNIKDGCGIHDILIPHKVIPVIITGRDSQIVLERCKEIGINEIYQGVKNKIETLRELVLDLSYVAYIGDDINDIPCMKAVKEAGGKIGCPADAVRDVIELADYIANKNGGEGAVREFIEWLVMNQD